MKRHAKSLSVLFVCVAAIFIVSSVASVPSGKVAAQQPGGPGVDDPRPPYYIAGYTYDAFGVPLGNCEVNITNLANGAWNLTTSDGTGFYMFEIANEQQQNGYFNPGDTINVTAIKDTAIGWNEAVTQNIGYCAIDVTLNGTIPEFPLVVLPVVGLMAMFLVVSLRRRSEK